MRKTARNQSCVTTVTDPAAARVFARERTRRFLLAFGGAPRSVSEAAAALGASVPQLFYHVVKFLRLGLIEVEREERRHGKPIKFYVTTAARFLVPAELIGRSCTEGLAQELRDLLEDNFERAGAEGVLFFADEEGRPALQMSTPRRARPGLSVAEWWQVLRLSDEDATSLARDMADLLARYEKMSRPGREYLVHAAIARRFKG